jgi:AcrR family transcriptional regulator
MGGHPPILIKDMNMPRLSEKDRDKIMSTTRSRLLEAAAEGFAAEGYASANINTISTSAGFAKGTIYNYFASKHALLLALIDETAELHFDLIAGAVRTEADPLQRVECFYQAGFEFVSAHLNRSRVIFDSINGTDQALKAYIFEKYQPMFRLVATEIIAPGTQAGRFKVTDPDSMASLLMTVYLGAAAQHNAEGIPWIDSSLVVQLVLFGLCEAGEKE